MERARRRLQGAALTAGMVVTSLNILFAAPIAGLWAASQATGGEPMSIPALGVFVVVAGAVGFALVGVLNALGGAHDRLAGRPRVVRRHVPWMRAMSGERRHYPDSELPPMGALDYVLVIVVAAAVLAFEVWFFFLSGSPIDQRSGR